MVARSGTYWGGTWRLAPSLCALVDQADALWPARDRSSDGSIGDTSHQASTSDHNPDSNGDVLAVDLDEDLAAGTDLQGLWRHLIATRDPRCKYLIYEATITASYPADGKAAWATRPYSGANAHKHHLHVSIHDTDAAKQDTSPWFPAAPEEDDDMPTTQEVQAATEAAINKLMPPMLSWLTTGKPNSVVNPGLAHWAWVDAPNVRTLNEVAGPNTYYGTDSADRVYAIQADHGGKVHLTPVLWAWVRGLITVGGEPAPQLVPMADDVLASIPDTTDADDMAALAQQVADVAAEVSDLAGQHDAGSS